MPAHRRRLRRRDYYRLKKEYHKSRTIWKIVKLLVILLLPVLLLTYIFTTTRFWDAKSKTAIAVARENGDVEVVVFDPSGGTLTIINIPGSTQVKVARSLGVWRLKSVGKLGDKEGLDGALLAETVTRHFRFPVFIWASSEAAGFANNNFKDLLVATFSPYKTNLGLGDRLHLLYFSLSANHSKKVTLDLTSTKYLKKTLLADGEEGYEVAGTMPAFLAAVFSELSFTSDSGRTRIVNRSGKFLGEEVASIAEVLGLKVVSIDDEAKQESDCEVVGKDTKSVRLLARIWECSEKVDTKAPLDLIMTIGSNFAARF